MAISYNKLWKLLVDKKMSKADLRKAAGIAPNTMTRLRRDEECRYRRYYGIYAGSQFERLSPVFRTHCMR